MSAHIAIWPKVRVTVDGKPKIVAKGDLVPEGVSATDLSNLVSFGAIAGVSGGPEPAEDPSAGDLDLSKSAKDILAWVGEDRDRAEQALAAEQKAKGDKARKGLLEGLDAVLNPPPAD